jgi:HAD superfamily hydrolase (TIGR01549 family)
MALRGVIFDLDGTLADTLPVCFAAFRHAFRETTGKTYTDAEITATFGPSEEGAIQRVTPDRAEEALELFFAEYERAHADCRAPFPGIPEALQRLEEQNILVAVVTGKGPRSAEISLRMMGLAGYFEHVEAGSPEGGVKPRAIGKVLAAWGLPAAEVAYVGDAPSDIPAARQAGVLPLAATWAATADYAALQALDPAAIFRTVPEFTEWIGEKVKKR